MLFERRLAAGLAVSCEGGPLGSLMLPLTWTDRGCVARQATSGDVEIRKKYGSHPEGQGFESP